MGNKYQTLSKTYLTNARKLMHKGNYLQAGEKLWGAASQIVKAYAQEKNISHDGHAKLFKIVDVVVKETRDEELDILFGRANELHINFYENWLTKEQVKRRAKDVEKFIKKIEKLLK